MRSTEEALIEFFHVMRPGNPPTVDTAPPMYALFFSEKRYDLWPWAASRST